MMSCDVSFVRKTIISITVCVYSSLLTRKIKVKQLALLVVTFIVVYSSNTPALSNP